MRMPLWSASAAIALMAGAPAAFADMAAAEKWINDEFQPSAISIDEQKAEMQWFIDHTGGQMSSVGEVQLSMATGIYSGTCHFFLVESSHRELVIAGPAATETMRLEDAAGAGEVLVSPATAAAVGPSWLAGERGGAAMLELDRDPEAAAPPVYDDEAALLQTAEEARADLQRLFEVDTGNEEETA